MVSDVVYPNNPSKYVLDYPIGYGAFSTVYRATCDENVVAVKIVDLDKLDTGVSIDDIRDELKIIRNFRHQNIISYYTSFASNSRIWVVMPMMQGGSVLSLLKCLKTGNSFPDNVISYVSHEVIKALVYIHKHQQIHRDIKAGNVLLTTDARVCLSDFGVSASMHGHRLHKTFVGTPCWMAPEILEQGDGYDNKIDIWSFGITTIEIATGSAPFQSLHPLKVMRNIVDKPPPTLIHKNEHLVRLVAECLTKNVAERPSAAQILSKYQKCLFDKGSQAALQDILRQYPPMDKRLPSKPTSSSMARNYGNITTGQNDSNDWDFSLGPDLEDTEFSLLPEEEM